MRVPVVRVPVVRVPVVRRLEGSILFLDQSLPIHLALAPHCPLVLFHRCLLHARRHHRHVPDLPMRACALFTYSFCSVWQQSNATIQVESRTLSEILEFSISKLSTWLRYPSLPYNTIFDKPIYRQQRSDGAKTRGLAASGGLCCSRRHKEGNSQRRTTSQNMIVSNSSPLLVTSHRECQGGAQKSFQMTTGDCHCKQCARRNSEVHMQCCEDKSLQGMQLTAQNESETSRTARYRGAAESISFSGRSGQSEGCPTDCHCG